MRLCRIALVPNRASIFGIRAAGLLHALADVIKLLTKEDVTPALAKRFLLQPGTIFLSCCRPLPSFAVIPFGDRIVVAGHSIPLQITALNSGLLYVFAMGSISVLGVVLAGWASGSTYPMIGGLRAAAQMVSYEVTLALSVIGIVLVYGTLRLEEMVALQVGTMAGFLPKWGLFYQPVGFILFLIALFAETNRNPFDMPEGEQEIVGYHTEYSSMRFAMFFYGRVRPHCSRLCPDGDSLFGGLAIALSRQRPIGRTHCAALALRALTDRVGHDFLYSPGRSALSPGSQPDLSRWSAL